jgi:hypothetical protein
LQRSVTLARRRFNVQGEAVKLITLKDIEDGIVKGHEEAKKLPKPPEGFSELWPWSLASGSVRWRVQRWGMGEEVNDEEAGCGQEQAGRGSALPCVQPRCCAVARLSAAPSGTER